MLLEIIKRKLSYYDKNLIKIDTWSAKASQFNHFDGTYHKKHYLKDGIILTELKYKETYILLMNIAGDLKSFDIDKCNERLIVKVL